MPDNPDVNYKIVCQGDDEAEVLIFDAIGPSFWEETVTAKQFVKDLKAVGSNRKLNVRINSPGGSVFDGTAIYNALKAHAGDVVVNIEGIALSMASVVAMAGNTVQMADNALMMVHNPQGVVYGEAKDMRKFADLMDKSKSNLIKAYAGKTGKSDEEISALMDAETWMTADEAFELGFVDAVTEGGQLVAAFDLRAISASGVKVPKHVEAKLAALFTTSCKEPDMAEQKAPERVPATIQQLEALEGSDNDFVLGQLKATATIDEAIVALNKKLLAQLKERGERVTTLEAEVDTLKKEPPATSETGVNPVASKELGKEGEQSPQPWGSDPIGFYGDQLKKLVAEGMNAVNASKAIRRKHPQLVEAMQQSG